MLRMAKHPLTVAPPEGTPGWLGSEHPPALLFQARERPPACRHQLPWAWDSTTEGRALGSGSWGPNSVASSLSPSLTARFPAKRVTRCTLWVP